MRRKTLFYFMLLLVFLYFFFTFDINFHGPDEPIYFAYTASVVEDGDLNVANQVFYDYGKFASKTYNFPAVQNDGGVVLWVPFYLYAKSIYSIATKLNLTGLTIGGLNRLTKCALSLSTVIFGLISILLTYFLCRKFFSRRTSAWSVLIIFLGTPFFYCMLFKTGNSNIVACLLSIISIWFCSYAVNMRKTHWFLYGMFFSICVTVRTDLWFQMYFIASFFIILCILRQADWRNGIYFLIGLMPVFILRAINTYLKWGVLCIEELRGYTLFLHFSRFDLAFSALFNPFRGFFYSSPVFFICLLGLIFAIVNFLKKIKNKTSETQDIFFIILSVYFILKLLPFWNLFTPGGDTLSVRVLLPDFPIFVLLFAQAIQKKYFRYFILTISLFLVFWNLLIISEFMAGLDWIYIERIPGIIERMPTLKYILYPLFYIKELDVKLKTCLPLILLVLGITFYIIKKFAKISNLCLRHINNNANLNLLSLFAIYLCTAYFIITLLNVFNNKINAEKLKAGGFFKNAKITEVPFFWLTQFEEEESKWCTFKFAGYSALRGNVDMLKKIRNYKEEAFANFVNRERMELTKLPLRPYDELANFFKGNGRFKKAIECYRDLIRMYPDDFEAYISLGDIYNAIGDYDKAIESYKQALSLKPNFGKLYMNLGEIYDKIGNLDQAIEFLQKAILCNPTLFGAYTTLGAINTTKGDYDKAIEYFQKAIQLVPNSFEPYGCIAEVYNSIGNYDRAIEYFQKSIQLKPGSVEAYMNLGDIYNRRGEYDKAVECFQKAIQLVPNSFEPYGCIADVYTKIGNYEKAIEYYQRYRQLNPGSVEAYMNLGHIYNRRGDYTKAKEYFQKAIQINPNSIDTNRELGYIYKERCDYDKAIEYFQKVTQINPNSIDANRELGYIYKERCDYDKAIEYFEKTIQLNPNDIGVLYSLGDLYNNKGDKKNALRQVSKLRELKRDDLADELERAVIQ